MKVDQCQHCTVRGDFDACKVTPCNQHESWYAVTMQAKIAALEADAARLKYLVQYLIDYEGEPGDADCSLLDAKTPHEFIKAIDAAMQGGA